MEKQRQQINLLDSKTIVRQYCLTRIHPINKSKKIVKENAHHRKCTNAQLTYRKDVGGVHEIRGILIDLADHECIRHHRHLYTEMSKNHSCWLVKERIYERIWFWDAEFNSHVQTKKRKIARQKNTTHPTKYKHHPHSPTRTHTQSHTHMRRQSTHVHGQEARAAPPTQRRCRCHPQTRGTSKPQSCPPL